MYKKLLKALQTQKMAKDFWAYYHEANSESVLTEREELLVRIAASAAVGCIP